MPVFSTTSLFRSFSTTAGVLVLILMIGACLFSLPYTIPRYDQQRLGKEYTAPALRDAPEETAIHSGPAWFGRDALGRSLLVRLLLGGAVSLSVGLAAAMIAMTIGTSWGMIAGFFGGKIDAIMMRIVDVLYGLPYLLLVILFAVAINGLISQYQARQAEKLAISQDARAIESGTMTLNQSAFSTEQLEDVGPELAEQYAAWASAQAEYERLVNLEQTTPTILQEAERTMNQADPRAMLHRFFQAYGWAIDLLALLIAIGAVSWLTLARVVRGQVLSLREQPFVEAARAIGVPAPRLMFRHILPNLIGPIIVYTTLAVPQAILQESILSFLGIGVQAPIPSWGNLAAEGLAELNPIQSHLWLILLPCLALGLTLLALNFVGDGLHDRFDPHGKTRGQIAA